MLTDAEFAKEQIRLQYVLRVCRYAEFITHSRSELDEKNGYRHGVSAQCYVPLHKISADGAVSFRNAMSAHVANAKAEGSLAPGIAQQYDLQLEALSDESRPDLQILQFPGFVTFLNCEYFPCSASLQ